MTKEYPLSRILASLPTGTVTVTANGRSVPVVLTVAESGRVVVRLPQLPRGVWAVVAVYPGDAALAGSRSASTPVWVFG